MTTQNFMQTQKPRAMRACVGCHKRKVRCDLGADGPRCTNCVRDGQDCQPRARKRRIRTDSESNVNSERPAMEEPFGSASIPPAQSHSIIQQQSNFERHPDLAGGQTRFDNLEVQGFPPAQEHGQIRRPDRASSISSASRSVAASTFSPLDSGYMGRSAYIAPEAFINEDGAYVYSFREELSEVEKGILRLQKAYDLPSRSIRDSLLDNFWSYCHPWTPIVDKAQITGRPQGQVSLLLLQAMLLAGSRMSSAPLSYPTSQDFYSRAKTIFWLGVEKNHITTLAAVCLLQWWNPHGPERVSIDTSGFWLRVAVSLAHQIGLHKDSLPATDASLHRKIWWSLVVSKISGLGPSVAVHL